MSKELLDYFGKILINNVRDNTIHDIDSMINKKSRSMTAEEVIKKIKDLDNKSIEVIKWLVPKVVDITLDHLLWTLEQKASIKVSVEANGEKTDNINDISDGLSGELYTEDGWIMKFSKERYEE